jgi:hypothetical protein
MKVSTMVLGGVIAALTTAEVQTTRADETVSVSFSMPVQAKVNVNESDCNNSPGPWITIDGEILLGGLQASLTFQNNTKGTHSTTVTYGTNVALLLPGGKITIPKQPVLGGVGGNPYIFIQFINGNGNALSDKILLGRCVQGLTVSQDLIDAALAATSVTAAGCDNSPGPTITMGGQLTLAGLKARLIFQNNLIGTHIAQSSADVDLIIEGTPVSIPKQPVLGGAGGNPLIWLDLMQGNGDPIGDPIFLGRCNQI